MNYVFHFLHCVFTVVFINSKNIITSYTHSHIAWINFTQVQQTLQKWIYIYIFKWSLSFIAEADGFRWFRQMIFPWGSINTSAHSGLIEEKHLWFEPDLICYSLTHSLFVYDKSACSSCTFRCCFHLYNMWKTRFITSGASTPTLILFYNTEEKWKCLILYTVFFLFLISMT